VKSTFIRPDLDRARSELQDGFWTKMSGPFVILGGGPCGLAAAWELARKGHRPIVIEREGLVGGLCATHAKTVGDETWRFDLGGHRFVSADAELSRWLESLLGDDLLTQERKSVVIHEGRRFRYPLDARNLLSNLGLAENAQALAGYAVARARARIRPRPDLTFEDWVVSRFGRPLYDSFFGPYTHKLWGIHPTSISSDWAAERISLLDLGDAALRMAGLRDTPIRTYARHYRYPRFGMGQLYEALAEEVRRLGGDVRTHTRFAELETHGGRVKSVVVTGARGTERRGAPFDDRPP
jgi:protoporphyrinogen oxidase